MDPMRRRRSHLQRQINHSRPMTRCTATIKMQMMILTSILEAATVMNMGLHLHATKEVQVSRKMGKSKIISLFLSLHNFPRYPVGCS